MKKPVEAEVGIRSKRLPLETPWFLTLILALILALTLVRILARTSVEDLPITADIAFATLGSQPQSKLRNQRLVTYLY